MISNVWQVQLHFRTPDDYNATSDRLSKLWKDQAALASRLAVRELFVASNQPMMHSLTLMDEVLRFICDSESAAVTAQSEFRVLMRNRGYTEVLVVEGSANRNGSIK